MRFLSSSADLSAAFKQCQEKYDHWSAAVAWASVDFPAWHVLLKYRKRIKRVTIGTHFYQTHPEVIERLAGDSRIHFVQQTDGVFHPKIYFFEKGHEWACICGSANFTKAATSINTEVCLIIDQDDASESLRNKLVRIIDDAWEEGKVPKPEYVAYYREQWKLKQTRLRELAGSRTKNNGEKHSGTKTGLPLHEIALVRMTWPQFVNRIKKEFHGTALRERLDVLDAGQEIFRSHKNFAGINSLDRKRIAGAVGAGDDGLDWKWFGSMRGAGHFKKLVNSRPKRIGQALDAIPLSGEVTDTHFAMFRDSIKSLAGVSLASGTRLLTMKRPDVFVPFNGPNRKKLCKASGLSQDISWDAYWQSIIGKIRQAIWYQVPSPKQPLARRIWNGRAAMLDALYFDEALK